MQAGRFGGKAGVKRASSAETGRTVAAQERRAAGARIAARADGSAERQLLAAAHTGLMLARRCEHRDALKREAGREMLAGREHLRRVAGTLGPSYPQPELRDDIEAYAQLAGGLAGEGAGS
jgi:hypothetical protein